MSLLKTEMNLCIINKLFLNFVLRIVIMHYDCMVDASSSIIADYMHITRPASVSFIIVTYHCYIKSDIKIILNNYTIMM